MNVYLFPSWLLTDENFEASKEIPVLINLGSWKAYQQGDMIGTFSARQVVSLAVEARGKNNFLPEEIHFISRFKEGDHGSQSVRAARMANMRKLTYRAVEFLRKANPPGPIPAPGHKGDSNNSIFHWCIHRHFYWYLGRCCNPYEQNEETH
jgi:hypothetical protein